MGFPVAFKFGSFVTLLDDLDAREARCAARGSQLLESGDSFIWCIFFLESLSSYLGQSLSKLLGKILDCTSELGRLVLLLRRILLWTALSLAAVYLFVAHCLEACLHIQFQLIEIYLVDVTVATLSEWAV